MSEVTSSGLADFDRLAALFRRTRAILDALLETGGLPPGATEVLTTETLPHIEDVEQGFHSRLRAAGTDVGVLRQLVQHAGLGLPEPRDDAEARAALIEAMQALSGAGGEREVVRISPQVMTALEHARVVLALLPATSPPDVHYPMPPRSYADIAAPRGPGEFVLRVEEIERTLWGVAAGARPRPRDAAYRRVYGYFDVGERLSGRGLRLD